MAMTSTAMRTLLVPLLLARAPAYVSGVALLFDLGNATRHEDDHFLLNGTLAIPDACLVSGVGVHHSAARRIVVAYVRLLSTNETDDERTVLRDVDIPYATSIAPSRRNLHGHGHGHGHSGHVAHAYAYAYVHGARDHVRNVDTREALELDARAQALVVPPHLTAAFAYNVELWAAIGPPTVVVELDCTDARHPDATGWPVVLLFGMCVCCVMVCAECDADRRSDRVLV